jgi:hypothetical protein
MPRVMCRSYIEMRSLITDTTLSKLVSGRMLLDYDRVTVLVCKMVLACLGRQVANDLHLVVRVLIAGVLTCLRAMQPMKLQCLCQ